jgi:hypothetical protein
LSRLRLLLVKRARRPSADEQNQQSVGQVAGLKLFKKVPILGERDNALRWLRHSRERTINSAAPSPVDPFEELIE